MNSPNNKPNHLEELLKDTKTKFIRIDKDTGHHIYGNRDYTYWYDLKAQFPKIKAMGYREKEKKE